MKTKRRFSILLLLAIVGVSCGGFVLTPTMNPTVEMNATLAETWTAVGETQTAIATPTFFFTQLPLTETLFFPQPTPSLPPSFVPTTVVMENGLTWTECRVPNRDYSRGDRDFLKKCTGIPSLDDNDKANMGVRIKGADNWFDFQLSIGSDFYKTKHDSSNGCCDYELLKNGEEVIKVSPGFMTSDPNRNLMNVGGKAVWELGGFTSVIVADGVNLNEKYQLEGSYFPYGINSKLIYITKKNGQFHIVYDEQEMGPAFDQISMPYCCAMIQLYYGGGQYWFVGRRGGAKYVVLIH